jgi:hypothetical protein
MKATVIDIAGRMMQTYQFSQSLYIPTEKLTPGVYIVRITGGPKPITQKILVTE